MAKEMGSLYWEVLWVYRERNEKLQFADTTRVHFAFTSLGPRSGDLALADKHLKLADDAIGEFGRGRNIQLNGMYNHCAGRVRLDQARIPESMQVELFPVKGRD
jgi:hypothetical protein